MIDIVLVAGAWHGGWAWERLIDHLPTDQFRPVAVDLPDTVNGAAATLDDHADHLHAVIETAGPDVVVVVHSYSGLVLQQVLARGSLRLAQVVLIDAWLGHDGDSMVSLAPAKVADFWRAGVVDDRIPAPSPAAVGVDDPDDAAWLAARMSPQPLRTFTDPISLPGPWLPREATAVICEPPSMFPFGAWARAYDLPVRRLRSGHDAMITVPAHLAEIIVELADR